MIPAPEKRASSQARIADPGYNSAGILQNGDANLAACC